MPSIRKYSSAFPFSLAAFWLALWPAIANASGPLGPNGTPITTSTYSVDLFQGPVFAGTRVTGLAGAYVAISEDVDGDLQNPATPAVRPFFSYSHFDYWLGFGLTFPATLQETDFFNSGDKTKLANSPDSFVFFVPAANLQWGEFGVGVTPEVQNYAISSTAGAAAPSRSITVTIPVTHLQLAHGFAHNQWVFGVGARFVWMSLNGAERQSANFISSGNGLEFGAVWKPVGLPLRLGAAFRSAIQTEARYREGLLPNDHGDVVVTPSDGAPIYLPKGVAFPWDVNLGFAVQLGRPFNPPWRTNDELIERQALQHRLRQLDREDERRLALESAETPEQRERIKRTYGIQQRADDRELERDLMAATRRIENDLLALNHFYVQIAGSMLVSGPVEQGVGVESLVAQTVNRSGERAVISLRLGVESGVVPRLIKLRAGTYLEPTRFDTSTPRVHGTLGVDVKLGIWNVFGAWPDDYMWRLGLAGDASHRYYTWGLTIGGWYPRHATPRPLSESDSVPALSP